MTGGAMLLIISLLLVASSAIACDRCVHQSKVAFFSKAEALVSGACGYGSLAIGFNGGRIAAAAPSIYKEGAGCGACFQMRCKNEDICSKEGTRIIVSDRNEDNGTDFVLSSRGFMGMAKGMGQDILKLGGGDVEYKRKHVITRQNLALGVENQPHPIISPLSFYQGVNKMANQVAKVDYQWKYKSKTGCWNNYGPMGWTRFKDSGSGEGWQTVLAVETVI
nr:expansin-like protein [Sesamum indicum]